MQPGVPFRRLWRQKEAREEAGSMTNRMRWPAVAAGLLATLVAGCSAQAVAGGRMAGGGAAGTASAVRAAGASPGSTVRAVPECPAQGLGVKFIGGQPGAGNDFVTIVAWDTAPSACRLAGPVTLVGVGSDGSADTNAVRLTVTGAGELTAHGRAPGAAQVLPGGESAAWLLMSAEYRDDPVTGALCTAHQVEPAAFRLTLPTGGTVTVANAGPHQPRVRGLAANGGLLTCRGELNTGPGLTRITIGSAM
jgi:hypothetical protein